MSDAGIVGDVFVSAAIECLVMSDADIVGVAIECLVTSDDGIVGDVSVSAAV